MLGLVLNIYLLSTLPFFYKAGRLMIVTSTGQLSSVKIVGRRSVNFFILPMVSTIVVILGSE